MSTTVLQMSFQNSRIFDKALIMEMNEAPGDIKKDFPNKETQQVKDLPNPVPRIPGRLPHQGSVASLESRSFIDQSEDQPLTEIHVCRYEECHKFRQSKAEKEESPVSPLKNRFLTLLIVLFALWIVVYAALSHLKVL